MVGVSSDVMLGSHPGGKRGCGRTSTAVYNGSGAAADVGGPPQEGSKGNSFGLLSVPDSVAVVAATAKKKCQQRKLATQQDRQLQQSMQLPPGAPVHRPSPVLGLLCKKVCKQPYVPVRGCGVEGTVWSQDCQAAEAATAPVMFDMPLRSHMRRVVDAGYSGSDGVTSEAAAVSEVNVVPATLLPPSGYP